MNQNGIGLGLKICSEIIKSLSGSINVDSKVDKGTIFTIKVPVKIEN